MVDSFNTKKDITQQGETVTPIKLDDVPANQKLGFDNEGNVVVMTRAYRRRKVQLEIDPRNLPKKKRTKKSKKNYLKKRKK